MCEYGVHPGNFTEPFEIVSADAAPPSAALYIEKDIDVLSAFHRNCKKDERDWAIVPHFRIATCTYVSAEGCRAYDTAQQPVDGKRSFLHGSLKPVTDCVLHVVGIRTTMALEVNHTLIPNH